ncbi:LuxR C-terminal-related transcriptional regulator [Nonomuraea sp. NPDC048882]|uniref:LuxR C-terminal-related transcriptional regulator n=1 Tax=Nonomuraea sp. NPDC048882 TaxID=3154347 RepID=UPI0033C326CC
MSEHGSCWPFVGRGGSLTTVREALRSGAGMMIAGAAGVGKSRLAAQAVAGLPGYAVVHALGTETAAAIPFGAFAHVLTGPPRSGENLLRWAARHLRGQAGRRGLLVSVDDAQRLDQASAALVHYLAESGEAQLLVTVRSEEPQPAPVTALWKDELLRRIELPPLTVAEVGQVLEAALGGEVSARTVRQLAGVSGGNVLYLRELVHAGRDSGCLAERGGTWRWSGEPAMTTRLRELVGDRIGHLDQDEREVLELVAFGEPVGIELLTALTSARAVERVEARGLVVTVTDGRRENLRLGHPLYGEVIRGDCGTLRTRRRLRTLAEGLEAAGLRRREDELRAAVWRLDSGSPTDPGLLTSAARQAWSRQDPRLAARLARAAIEAGAGVGAVAVLGEVLTVLGETGPALSALSSALSSVSTLSSGTSVSESGAGASGTLSASGVSGISGTSAAQGTAGPQRAAGARDAMTEGERAQHACSLGMNLAWAGADAEACRVLDTAVATLTEPGWRQEAYVYRAVADCFAGRLSDAAESLAGARSCVPATARGRAHAAALETWVDAYAGRQERTLARAGRTADTGANRPNTPTPLHRADARASLDRPHAPASLDARESAHALLAVPDVLESAHALPTLLDALCVAHLFSGRLEEAARAAERGMELPAAELPVTGFAAHLAMAARLRGDAAEAVRRCGDDLARLPEREPYLGRCLAEQAHAFALLGRLGEATRALAEAEEAASRWAFTRQHVLHASVWVTAAGGDVADAVRRCLAAAEHAERHELRGHLMFALHDLVRLGAAPAAVERLRELAALVEGPLVKLLARHARALGDPGALREVAGEFERRGLLLYAAEATAHEAVAYRETGRGTLARGARTRAWALARRCSGISTPALVELATPELTPRQREIVQLAAAGLTNRQIADRLTLSTRTAANHLQAAYDKLGVNDRTQVARLLTAL